MKVISGLGPQIIDDSHAGNNVTYRLGASCSNCGWKGEVKRTKGYEPRYRYGCPRCDCRTVRANKGDFRGSDA